MGCAQDGQIIDGNASRNPPSLGFNQFIDSSANSSSTIHFPYHPFYISIYIYTQLNRHTSINTNALPPKPFLAQQVKLPLLSIFPTSNSGLTLTFCIQNSLQQTSPLSLTMSADKTKLTSPHPCLFFDKIKLN